MSCRKARRLARRLIGGHARYVNNGYSYNSYFVLPGGWRGQMHTGAWILKNTRRPGEIGGELTTT